MIFIKKIIQEIINSGLNPVERYLINKYKGQNIIYSPVFIIGAPRTGSTILYEYVTNYLDLKYINNFMAKFYKSLYLSSLVSHKIFKDESHDCFDSKHGKTYGLNAPHECGSFWYRWLPKDKHFVKFDEIDSNSKDEIYTTITAITNKFNKPFIFKNLNAGQRMRLIKETFPNALFIYIKRNPLYTAQSILRGREKTYNDRSKWWSIMPKEYDELLDLPYPEQIVKQIYYLQKQIETDLSLFPSQNSYVIKYKDFCFDTEEEINLIKEFLENNYDKKINLKKNINPNKVYYSNEQKIDDKTFHKLKEIINQLNWGHGNNNG